MNTIISQTHNLTSQISRPTGPCVRGTYAEVNRCNLKENGNKHKWVAVKSYKSKFDGPLEENSKTIRSEIQLLSNLPQHVNVVPFLGFKNDGGSLASVMPWMPAGNLTSFIRTHGATLKTAAKTTLLHEISSGLEHLHSNFVVHGNLESDNVLITEGHSACLSGFRQSVKLSSRDAACPQFQMPPKPAIQFAGPEWFVKGDGRFQLLSKSLFKSDIYSLGCLMFYIFTKSMPWRDATSVDISDQLRICVTPSRPKGPILNDDQWALISRCLSLLPQDRPSTLEVLFLLGPPDLTGQIQKKQEYPDQSGGYGSVYECMWNSKTGGQVKVAVKVMHVRGPLRVDEVKKNLKRELAAWRRLSHPNIASLLGTVTGFGHLQGMVSLWMKNGSLHRYLDSKKDTPLSRRLRWVKDIAEGLKYLHKDPIIHGDLTPLNVLIDDDERAVLTDFGLSIILGGFTSLSVTYTNAEVGAPGWAAPELFPSSKGVQSPSPSTASDVYSFACLMYLIFTGSHLWDVKGNNAGMAIWCRVKEGDRPPKPSTIDTQHWGLIEQCWASEPSLRPKINDVLLGL